MHVQHERMILCNASSQMVTKKLMYRMLEFLCTTFRIPHVSHREALIEAQPSFTHMGIFDQLHRALELVQEEKKAKAAEKAANGHVYNGAGHSGTKVTNGVNGHTYTHPHEYNGTGNKCENGSHENGGQRKRRDSGRHSRTENGSHSNNLADYPLLSPEELARHKVAALNCLLLPGRGSSVHGILPPPPPFI